MGDISYFFVKTVWESHRYLREEGQCISGELVKLQTPFKANEGRYNPLDKQTMADYSATRADLIQPRRKDDGGGRGLGSLPMLCTLVVVELVFLSLVPEMQFLLLSSAEQCRSQNKTGTSCPSAAP